MFGLASRRFRFDVRSEACASLTCCWHFARHRRLPTLQRTLVDRRVVGERLIGNFGDDFSVVQHAHLAVGSNAAHFHRVQSPFFENAKDFLLAAFLRHQQHALLRFAQHDFVGSHAGFTLGHEVEFDFSAHVAASAHFAGGAGKPGSAHILNADDGAGLHGLKAGFEQQLFQKGIAHLHVGPLGLGGFAELFAGHGGAVNAVAAGLRANINYGIAFARGLGIENLVAADQSQSESVDQRIARVARLELGFAAQVGDAEAVAVGSDSADYAFQDGMVLVELLQPSSARPAAGGAAPRGREWGRSAGNPLPLPVLRPW